MTLADRFSSVADQFSDKIKDQEWFRQLESSFDELPPEQQKYVKWGGLAALILLGLYIFFSVLSSANSVKNEYFEKQDLLQTVNQSGEEIRRLKGQNSGFTSANPSQSWKGTLENMASAQGLQPQVIEVTKETPGASQNVIQETLLEAQMKNVPVRSLVAFLYQLEHGSPPVKIKGIETDTTPDGMVNARLQLSGFMPKPEKK